MGLFDGMDQMGLKKISQEDLFKAEEPAKKGAPAAAEAKAKPAVTEESYLLERTMDCPVCGSKFKVKAVKSGRVRRIGQDKDLRPRFEQMDTSKYDVVVCPGCGYAAMTRDFKNIMDPQKKMVLENIKPGFKYEEPGSIYSYDDAIKRYQIALVNAMTCGRKDSEKAYLCLKMGWVIRGKGENLDKEAEDYEAQLKKCNDDENEALKLAFDGFIAARQKEEFPMAGMEQSTLDYLLSVLAMRFDRYDIAAKLVTGILGSRVAGPKIKDLARDLKEEIVEHQKAKEEG